MRARPGSSGELIFTSSGGKWSLLELDHFRSDVAVTLLTVFVHVHVWTLFAPVFIVHYNFHRFEKSLEPETRYSVPAQITGLKLTSDQFSSPFLPSSSVVSCGWGQDDCRRWLRPWEKFSLDIWQWRRPEYRSRRELT